MKEKISVIVPIYNAEPFLEKCLTSLQCQTHENLQILLIDDGSTDGSGDICRRFAAADDRFEYHYQENRGVSAARNLGLDLARGEFVGFCDSDDWVDTDFFEALYRLVCEQDVDISIVSLVREDGVNPAAIPADDPVVYTFTGREAIAEMHRGGKFGGILCNKLFRRTLLDGLRLREDVVIFEDMLIVWHLFHRAKKVAFRRQHKYHYLTNPRSALRREFRESLWTGFAAVQEIYQKTQTHYPEDIDYARRTLIYDSYWFAEKLAVAGKLTKEKYAFLSEQFDCHYNDVVEAMFSSRQKAKFGIFRRGRGVFLIYMGIVKGYRRLGLWLTDLRK